MYQQSRKIINKFKFSQWWWPLAFSYSHWTTLSFQALLLLSLILSAQASSLSFLPLSCQFRSQIWLLLLFPTSIWELSIAFLCSIQRTSDLSLESKVQLRNQEFLRLTLVKYRDFEVVDLLTAEFGSLIADSNWSYWRFQAIFRNFSSIH